MGLRNIVGDVVNDESFVDFIIATALHIFLFKSGC